MCKACTGKKAGCVEKMDWGMRALLERHMRALRERHNLKRQGRNKTATIGEVVLIRNDSKNRGKWNIGIVTKLLNGRDGVVRGARLKSRKTSIERPIQDLYPLELSTETNKKNEKQETLDLTVKEFRPKRVAAELAKQKIKKVGQGRWSIVVAFYIIH